MGAKAWIFAGVAAAATLGGVWWAVGAERRAAADGLRREAGLIYSAAAPSGHGALAACVACHRIEPGGPERSAPSLRGVVGAAKANADWFGYSPALRRVGGVWSPAELDRYLADPTAAVPGTFKTLSPMRDPAERRAVVEALAKLE
jgi:cytochrome c